MTGRAFSEFLADAHQIAVLEAVQRLLAPGGGFLFETRNPAARSLNLEERIAWERSHETSDGLWIDAHALTRFDEAAPVLHVHHHRRVRDSGEVRRSRIALR